MHDIGLIMILAVGLSGALLFGYLTQRLGLSPIVGYLFAGIAIGPHTPGFVGDIALAGQLAEIGVILLMFGVGLHFRLHDLIAVRGVAIPGAIGQILVSAALGAVIAVLWDWHWSSGVILGTAISVASTVVLVRVLMDNDVLETTQGHIAVGWLIVEDIFTILVLVLLPMLSVILKTGSGDGNILISLVKAALKLVVLTATILWAGKRFIPWLLMQIARTRSRELFTLTVLVLAIAIATGSAMVFGASFALGAFLAGMVVGQSKAGLQAAADALPMRDAFAVLFFISIGMLFDPRLLITNPGLILAVLAVILVGKPIIAFVLVIFLRYSIRAALTVAVALAQIGEFSFILAAAAKGLGIFPQEGFSTLIAGSLISISLNPILFKHINTAETFIRKRPALWKFLNRTAGVKTYEADQEARSKLNGRMDDIGAIVVGYGPVGKTVCRILTQFGIRPVVVELNIDTVHRLTDDGVAAVYGDAANPEILKAAGVRQAKFLILTVPDLMNRITIMSYAREMNEKIVMLVRTRYLAERQVLEDLGAAAIAYEEAEAAVGLAQFLLRAAGIDEDLIFAETKRIRQEITGRSSGIMPQA